MTERLPQPVAAKFPALQPRHVRVLPSGTILGRIYDQTGPHPVVWNEFRSFGPTNARFDHHPAGPGRVRSDHAVLYCAAAAAGPAAAASNPVLRTCIAERCVEKGFLDLRANTPTFTLFSNRADTRLLDLADSDWVALAGGNAAIAAGKRSTARKWARAIYSHYTGGDALDGMYYPCSIIPSARSVVLWERAQPSIEPRPLLNKPLADPALLAEIEAYAAQLRLDLIL